MSASINAVQAKQEAESFLRRVQVEFPHLIPLGYQAIINVTVQGMKNLGIDSGALTEGKFLAGLQNALDMGLAPKPPVVVQTITIEAQLTPEQLEAQRLAAEAAERERKFANQLANERSSGRVNHADRQNQRASLRQSVKDTLMPVAQQQAKVLAEELKVYTPMGKIDWGKTKDLQGAFVYTDASRTAVDWVSSLSLRKRLARAADDASRNRFNNRS
jgi:hypothetical protein